MGVCYTGFRFLDWRCRKALGVVSLFLSLLTSALETVGGSLFRSLFFLEGIEAGLGSISCTILLFALSGNLWISLSFILAGRPALWCTMVCCFYYGQGNGIGAGRLLRVRDE